MRKVDFDSLIWKKKNVKKLFGKNIKKIKIHVLFHNSNNYFIKYSFTW